MSLAGRRRQSANAKKRNRELRAKRAATTERQCRMPECTRLTARPLGYCDHCWNEARRAEQ